jgi:hypothetical protein
MCGTQMRDRVVQQSSTDPTASRALLNKMLSTDSDEVACTLALTFSSSSLLLSSLELGDTKLRPPGFLRQKYALGPMVVLGGRLFLNSEVPLHSRPDASQGSIGQIEVLDRLWNVLSP